MKQQNRSRLELIEISGSARGCGENYGRLFSTLIKGFCAQEVYPSKERLNFARRCIPFVRKYAPISAAFMNGMAKGSGLSLEEVALITLHEEIYHQRSFPSHCTAIVSLKSNSRDGKTYIAQNWDWQPQMYPWAGLVKLSIRGQPSVLAYHYPGLWQCCGINSKGLALMWTGGGYFPRLKPGPGVPTYVLVSEVLRKSCVNEAVAYLYETPRAGPFMFLVADSGGHGAVIEATSDAINVEEVNAVSYRANLFRLPEIKKKARQKRATKKIHSTGRMKAVQKHLDARNDKLDLKSIRTILCDRNVCVNIGFRSLTIDQFIANCEDRYLLVKRGPADDSWIRYGL